MARFQAVLILLASVVLSGCLNSTTVINVTADGSGTIEQTFLMNKQAMAQLQQMTAAAGQGGGKKLTLFDEQAMRNAAPQLGEGVTFVSATPLNTADSEGTRALYEFHDITKLRMDQKPSTPRAGVGTMGMPGGNAPENILFRFGKAPGGNPRVTVVFPEAKVDEARRAAQAQQGQAAAKPGDPMQAAALAMLKPMLNGMKISIVLQPAGRIVKTNSPFVHEQQVTLLELDLGQLLADDTMLQKLQGAGSLEDIKGMLKGVKGAKVNPDREVSVEFVPKPAPKMRLPIPKR
jgi:hypothetical protein